MKYFVTGIKPRPLLVIMLALMGAPALSASPTAATTASPAAALAPFSEGTSAKPGNLLSFIDEVPAVPAGWQRLRETYQDARKAIEAGEEEGYRSLLAELKTYPLLPYLEYAWLSKNLDTLGRKELEQFRERYQDTPLPPRLHRQWLHHLGDHKRWRLLVENFDPRLANTSLQCQKRWADYKLGDEKKAFSQLADLWVVGASQPQSCDPIFKAWMDARLLTEDHAWARFWLALERSNIRLARYVTRYLHDERKAMASTALTLHRDPQRLASTALPEQGPAYSRLVIHTLQRLARRDTAAALEELAQRAPSLGLSEKKLFHLQRAMGLRMLRRYEPDSETWVSRIDPQNRDLELLEWRIRNQLTLGNWGRAGELMEHLPAAERRDGRWRYWQARILAEQGGPEALNQANALYRDLSEERSFYGFMASHRLGGGYALNHRPWEVDPEALETLAADPALIRARELRHQGQLIDARREWYQATLGFTAEQHYQAAYLARHWGWYQQGIRSAIAAREWDDLHIRFPAPHTTEIASSAARFQIDPPWIFAVARQESAFMADARSHAGARGLMQLMPATARQTARAMSIHYHGPHELSDPDLNIQLGSAYLAKMFKRYGGNRVLATAAYNAGPGRVSRWLSERGELPVDVWIETIPFDETRRYVQNVLSYAVIYGDLLGYDKAFLKPVETHPPASVRQSG